LFSLWITSAGRFGGYKNHILNKMLDCPISRTPITDLLIVEFWSGPIFGSLKTQGQSVMAHNLAFLVRWNTIRIIRRKLKSH